MKENMQDKKIWSRVKQTYKLDSTVTGTVEHHAAFGVFVDLGDSDVRGLIQVTDFLDEGTMDLEQYPAIGQEVEAVVKGYTEDERRQIWLSMKPSDLSEAKGKD